MIKLITPAILIMFVMLIANCSQGIVKRTNNGKVKIIEERDPIVKKIEEKDTFIKVTKDSIQEKK